MSLIRTIFAWHPRTPFYYGWLVLGTAALGALAATGITQLVLGAIQGLILEDMGWDRSTLAYAVTAGTWASGLLTPLVGRLADRYGPRGLMPVAILIVGVSFFALAGISAVWQFYAAYIIARTIAHPNIIGVVPRTVAVNFFQRRRNFALGLTSMARPVGGAINIQVISLISRGFSWRVAYRVLGIFALALAVPLFVVMRRRPEDIGLQPDGDTRPLKGELPRPRAAGPEIQGASAPKQREWRVGEAVFTSTFWLIVVVESLGILTEGAVAFQVVPYLTDSGLSYAVAAGALSLSALLGALVNPGWGYLSDRFSPRKLALVAVVTTAAVTTLFLTSDSGRIGFFVVILWGTASGGLSILGSMMLADYFGRAYFGSITGLMGPIQLGFLGLGPTFGAVLYKLTGDYTAMFLFAVSAYALAALCIYSVKPPVPRPKRPAGGRDLQD